MLNYIPIMTIAYDNVPGRTAGALEHPAHSRVRLIHGPVVGGGDFGLLLIGLRWVADPQLQDMISLIPP